MKDASSLCKKTFVVLSLGFLLTASRVMADMEIDLGEETKPTPTVAPTPTVSVEASKGTGEVEADDTGDGDQAATGKKEVEEEATPTVVVIHGVLKMKDVYAAGIKNYQDQDYSTAIQYLKKALDMKDPYSEKFYYAEAAAMLGVIYQFHMIHYDLAYHYYRMALKFEAANPTAKRHLSEVKRLLKKGR